MEPTWEPKWTQNGAEIVPRCVGNEKSKKCENRTGASTGARFSGSGLLEKASIWEPNAIKNRIRIEVKIKIDFKADLGAKMEPKWSPKGAKMGAKSEKNLSKIDVKFEVDFGCDFDAILAMDGAETAECANSDPGSSGGHI